MAPQVQRPARIILGLPQGQDGAILHLGQIATLDAILGQAPMNRPFRKIILHVGDMKTGSTSIQAALAGGDVPDVGVSIAYPGRRLNHNFMKVPLTTHAKGRRPRLDEFRETVRAERADLCVISAELLSLGDPQILREVFEAYLADLADDYAVLHYFRPHIEGVISRHAEDIKIGKAAETLEDHINHAIDSGRYHHASRIKRWQDVFGSRYQYRPMIRAELARQDVVADFFTTILGPLPDTWKPRATVNESLPSEALEVLRLLQSHTTGLPQEFRSTLGREFARLHAEVCGRRPACKPQVPAALARRMAIAFEGDARQMDALHFGGRPLYEPALRRAVTAAEEAEAQDGSAPAQPSVREVAELLSRLVAHVAAHTDARALGIALRDSRIDRLARGLSA